MYVLLGCVVFVVGVLGAWQRKRLMDWSTRWNQRSGPPGEMLNAFQSERGYLIGGFGMALAGLITIVYGLTSGR
ncbi:hypothetical protein J2T23_003786 [Pseudarthrobacter niigatensis]|uniref:Uncharacterized protein n=1 Tax=Pseudarthrobacter niigatensis TaxID=369935 RepID=A0AAJ1T1A4_9MICC|nr:hypothetical protein [Pseudarthrobacter niigatensis]MDQ0267848.1 hypothetical protein [Pseudarthrobacter niigatensis]